MKRDLTPALTALLATASYLASVATATTVSVISQNGISSTCAQTYYAIDPATCSCKNVGCPVSSKGSDPMINEFATNAVLTESPYAGGKGGNYVFIDEYWNYIQQIEPDASQVYPPKSMVQQHCDANRQDVYRVHVLEYSYSENVMYGIAMVPNNTAQVYDSKVVQLDPKTGKCVDVLTNIVGSENKLPSGCCGANNRPAFDDTNKVFYFFGANGYKSAGASSYTMIAANIATGSYSIGVLPSNICAGYGFSFFDDELGLFALARDGTNYAIYKLTTGWGSFATIESELVLTLGKVLPSTATYDTKNHKLYLMYEELTTVTTVSIQKASKSDCNMPASCAGQLW
jgi:hypothetical protein